MRQKKLKYSHVTVSQRSWKTKVEAVYRHRWIKRSSRLRLLRAGNVRPKVACRVSRGFLDLLGPFLPPSRFVEVCFLFPSPKIPSAIYSTNFLREERKAVHLDEGGRIRTTVFHPFSSRFDGVALMATLDRSAIVYCYASARFPRKQNGNRAFEFLIQSGSNNIDTGENLYEKLLFRMYKRI